MHISFDPSFIANIVAIVGVGVSCVAWAVLSRRVVGFLLAVGASVTMMIASRSDLVPVHLEAIGLVGAVLTALLAIGYILIRASLRRRRVHRVRARQGQSALQFAPVERTSSRQADRVRRSRGLPAPEVEAREVEYADGYEYEDDGYEEEYEALRRPARQSVASRPRQARPRQARPQQQQRQYSRARGARLQQ
jgi:hypothetical protein